jgi:hypothetical protein
LEMLMLPQFVHRVVQPTVSNSESWAAVHQLMQEHI